MTKRKEKVFDELCERLDTKDREKDLYRMARQMDQAGKDMQEVRVMKDRDGNVLTSEENLLTRWKKYTEGLMNEENKMGSVNQEVQEGCNEGS